MKSASINFALRPSVLSLFVALTVPVFIGTVAVTYVSNDRIARSNADTLVERFVKDAIVDMVGMFEPIKSLLRSAATLGREQPGFFAEDKALPYLSSVLSHRQTIVSVYAGLENGSFRQARQLDATAKVLDVSPPAETAFAYRTIARAQGAPGIDAYRFLDRSMKELGSASQPTSYDPRLRPWYQAAAQTGGLVVTEPDLFAAFGLIGFTVAAPYASGATIDGVVAADITLDGLSDYLAGHTISPNSQSYIIDADGRVIANSKRLKTYTSVNGRLQLKHVTSLGDELPARAFTARPGQSEQLYTFEAGGQEYRASMAAFPESFGQRWQLFVITPLKDFTEEFDKHNRQLLIFGLFVILIQILVIYALSNIISAPLEALATKVATIQDLESESAPGPISTIREVAVLSRAIDTLDTAVRSFASFVPIGLVKQLLETDQKLELGGNSRFLTILFSDLEAFSTLSEEVPSQELFLLISSYLELVTHSVNAEDGTIDKFIGDGAMAFWGAPALLEDHAWRACVAALRIQNGMAELNSRWAVDGRRPLRVRVGIHSDAVLVGNVGSKARMSYTVMGDGVNLAARLEGINKEFGTRISISHAVFKEAGERLCVRPLFEVTVKGRRAKTPIYELLGAYGAGPEFEPDERTLTLCRMTRHAYAALVDDNVALALERYAATLAEFPEDPVAAELIRRLSTPGSIEGQTVSQA